MVGSVALERRVGTSYETIRTFLSYALPAQLSSLVTSMLYGNHHDTVQTAHTNGQVPNATELSNPALQVILENPGWEMAKTSNQREALVVSSLAKLGYKSASGLYNPKGRHAILGEKGMIVSLDVLHQTYTPANGSIPHDMTQVLNKAGFKPRR